MAEQPRYEPGMFCWAGLATSDPHRATAFYTALFGWKPEELRGGQAGSYTLLRRDAEDAAILYRQTAEARSAGAPPHWTSYISVEDAAATAARAGELGGAAVFREPFDVLGAGRVVAVSDPLGAIVSLWQPRSRVGATVVKEIGALCWNELAAYDVERAKSFYRDLLGWEYQTDRSDYTTSDYTTIKCAGRLNGGIRAQSRRAQRASPAWLPYFGVESTDTAASRAWQLGGRQLGSAWRIPLGRTALLADPQGAAFAVLEVSQVAGSGQATGLDGDR